MKKLFSFIALAGLVFTLSAQITTPRFGTTANKDNTGRVLTYAYVAPAYAASYAIVANAYETTVKMGTLTGAQTLTATVTNCHVTDKLSIVFVADGTNRVVTFSTGFASGGNITVNSSTTMTVNFVFNGTGWVQQTANDLVTGLAGDGTVGAPSIGFASDTDNGLYRIGANNYGAAAAGAKVLDISATGLGVTGRLTTSIGTVRKATSTAFTGNATVTAAQLSGGLLTITSGTDTLTLPTATLLATELGATAGTIFEFSVINIASGGTALLAVGSGITTQSAVTGGETLTVANSATEGAATFRITFLSATVAILSRIN